MWLHEVLRRSQACGLVVLVTALTRGCSRPDAGPPEGRTAGTAMTAPDTTAHRSNRLIREKSPYLLQHANNPVEWYPWGEEALAKANAEKKPIFLSIGYSTCHWCHVMERESFEDPEIAELMNRWFVNIKVDREEHPDLDQIYMRAVTALTGHGGWPLTVFLTPDRQPFFGGTYFPPERRWNVPGLKDVLSSVAEAWRTKRQEIVTSAEGLTAALQQELAQGGTTGAVDVQTLHDAFNHATRSFDAAHGGFGDAPKFPRGHELSFLLHYWARTHTAQALEIATTTLDHMARGGLHDHLGGGFHRYATDARWLVPHFEKMLYDQALLGRTYLEAYRITRRDAYAKVARGIFEYVLRDLTDAQGGFYSAEDADSEGEEGKFYVWTSADVTDVLGAEEAQLFCRFYGVTGEGNFEHGTSILNVEQALEDFATLKGYEPGALATRLSRARARLLEARAKRVRPHRDDKILTSWNGLMIASFAYGGAVLGEPRYLEAARRAAEFVLATLRRDGVLLRRYRDGASKYPGTLEDYAFFAHGLVELYEASFDPRYLAQAKLLASAMVDRFWDEASGGFFLRDWHEPMLIVRSKDVYDSATPSGNSVAALVLLRLGRLTAEAALEQYGRRTLDALAETVARAPFGYPQMLMAWDFGLGPTREIVIVGEPSSAGTAQLVGTIRQRFMPRAVVLQLPDGAGRGATEALAPYVKAQHAVGGAPTAYVCENFVCRLPVTSADELGRLLDAAVPELRGS